jgi:RNA polymerase sigma-70 factor (ECF subfamily)
MALVRRVLAGDEVAFRQFFDTCATPLFRFARARLHGDERAAEDVVQAVFGRAFAKLETYRGEASLLTWVTTICRREIADHFSREGRLGQAVFLVEEVPEIRAALESLGSVVANPEEQLQKDEIARRVWVALDTLPVRYGKALELRYIQGLSVPEIAERLGLGLKAAESVLSRARDAFRDAFTTMAAEPTS